MNLLAQMTRGDGFLDSLSFRGDRAGWSSLSSCIAIAQVSPTAPPQAKQLCTPPERHKGCPFGWLVPPVWDHASGLHRLGRRRQRGLLLCAVLKGHPNSSGLKFSSISTGAKSKRRRGQVTRPAQRAVSKILPPSIRFGLRDFRPKADLPQSVGT